MTGSGAREGFSLVEVIVAIVILSIGILAMTATTGYIFTRLRDSGVGTERMFAVQQAMERLRAVPYDSIDDRDAGHAATIGEFQVWWSVDEPTSRVKRITIVSEGPGYAAGEWTLTARDTTVVSVFAP